MYTYVPFSISLLPPTLFHYFCLLPPLHIYAPGQFRNKNVTSALYLVREKKNSAEKKGTSSYVGSLVRQDTKMFTNMFRTLPKCLACYPPPLRLPEAPAAPS